MPYIVMERIDGVPLASVIASAPRPPEEVARTGAALADAVQSVHAQDVVHLDLKPENVLLRPSGEVVLLDFGFARHAHYPISSARKSISPRARGVRLARAAAR
jgi:non-specific serine/threonine protein kinase/protein-serine/threonine kinase